VFRRSILLVSILFFTVRAPAQVPPPIPAPPPVPAVPPIPPLLPPVPGTGPGLFTPGTDTPVPLQFLDTDVKDLLALYEKWTGRHLIYNAQLAGQIRLFVSGQVPQSEAVKLVEMTMLMNGFNILPTEDPKIWKVTGTGQNPKSYGIPFVDREELLPPGEQTVMFLFKLTWADPTELAQTIQSGILVPNQAGGGTSSVTPLAKSQSLLVTENTNIIRTLIRIVRAIDVEPAEVMSEFITLQHAQAEELAGYLEKLFDKQQAQQTATPGAPGVPTQPRVVRANTDPTGAPLPPGVPSSEGNLSLQIHGSANGLGPTEDNFVVGKVRITADKRTNRLHVVSRPVNMKLIRALIKEYDSQVPLAPPAVRPLRFRPVEEVMDAIVAAIKDPGEKDSGGTAGAPSTARPQTQGQTTRNTNQNTFGSTNSTSGSSSSSSSSGGTTGGETLSTSERDTLPVTQQVGKSTIIADKRANSIIVVGPKDTTEKVFALLDKLDVPQAQVMIHTIIGELKLSKNESFGLEYILKSGGIVANATGTTTGTTGTTTAADGTTTATSTSVLGFDSGNQAGINLNNFLSQTNISKVLSAGGAGVTGIIASGNNLDVVLTALEASDRFRVITKPSIFTTNNKKALITSGEQVPVPTSIQSAVNSTTNSSSGLTTQSSVQYKDIELRLEVLPLINSDKDVSLEIVQNISERSGSTKIDNNDIPNIAKRSLKTYVTVPNNGTLILGGLIKESVDLSKSGLPVLGNIPLIGPLFARTSKAKVRNELIVIMRPVVTLAPAETARLREKTFEGFEVPADLEAAIAPPNMRQHLKSPQKAASLRSSAPKLREDTTNSASMSKQR
jgi:general secretion pathway protein D